MRQIILTPKYSIGNIVETRGGKIGKIVSARCSVDWCDIKDGLVILEYRIGSLNDFGYYREDEIKRVISEK